MKIQEISPGGQYKERERTESQRKRKKHYYSLRKEKRDCYITNKRKKSNGTRGIEANMTVFEHDGRQVNILNECYKFVMSNDDTMRTKGVILIRSIISSGENPPIQKVIDMGLVPAFISFLRSENLRLVYESAWILTNIACGESQHVEILVQHGAEVPLKDIVMNCPSDEVKEQAVWCLGNIAGENINYRNLILSTGVFSHLVDIVNEKWDNHNLSSNCVWAISNLCRGKPIPEWGQIYTVLDIIPKVLTSKNPALIFEALWIVSGICEYHIQAVLEKQLCPLVIDIMKENNYLFHAPTVRIIGNIALGENHQTQELLSYNILPLIKNLLMSPEKQLVRDICWTISNLSAGTPEHVQQIIDSGIYQILIKMLPNSDWEIQKEIIWSLSNASSAPLEQAVYLIDIGTIDALISMITKPDTNITKSILEGFLRFLSIDWPYGNNTAAYYINQGGGLKFLEILQEHESPVIWSLANSIVEQYFCEDI